MTLATHLGCGSLSSDEPDRIVATGPMSYRDGAPAEPAWATARLVVEHEGGLEQARSRASAAISGDVALLVNGGWTSSPSALIAHVFRRGMHGWALERGLELTGIDAMHVNDNAVAISGGLALIGAPTEDGSRGAYVLSIDDGPDAAVELIARPPVTADHFGAAVSLSGSTALVGAPGHANSRGAVYVFERSARGWEQVHLLSAPDGADGDSFGRSVSLSGDTAMVGAQPSDAGRGRAYLFERHEGDWLLDQRFSALAGEAFGHSVCVSDNTAVIGAPNPGVAFVFEHGPDGWGAPMELSVAQLAGSSLSLSGDTLLIGSPLYRGQRGAAYVFHRDSFGWSRWATLTDAAFARPRMLGFSVSMSGDTGLVGGATFDGAEAQVFSLEQVHGEGIN